MDIVETILYSRYLPDLLVLALVAMLQIAGGLYLRRALRPALGRQIPWAIGISLGVVVLGFLLRFDRVARHFPQWAAGWGRGMAVTWAFLSVFLLGAFWLQLADAITGNKKYRSCLECGRWFEISADKRGGAGSVDWEDEHSVIGSEDCLLIDFHRGGRGHVFGKLRR